MTSQRKREEETKELAFVQIGAGRVFVGWGPFEPAAERDPERPAFYRNDFFLSDPEPWKHPHRWETMPVAELATLFGSPPPPHILWNSPQLAEFEELFTSARLAIEGGRFSKIVPVVFEHGASTNGGRPIHPYLLSRLGSIPETLLCYGWISGDSGFIGATPEMLFASRGEAIETVAIAGTRPTGISAELLVDQKERKEHDYVTTDIVERLSSYGSTRVESIEVMELPTISHLRTRIRFEPSGPATPRFDELVQILHPTAALGVWPRNEEGQAWLRRADENADRGAFGAPFGVEAEDGTGLCLVAIRNIEWRDQTLRIGAGSGIVAESGLEGEFEELRNKREQVRKLFGMNG
ncbi:MAG TPA: chorismate-binding protein [Thermoanaerobaculia bacterium]|nr:chorismate-binding protein [Thermoanaerobaculia bacterium]